MALIIRETQRIQEERGVRQYWVGPWIERRRLFGQYHTLFQELERESHGDYQAYIGMDPNTLILSPPKAPWLCLQRACKVRDTHVRCRASMWRLRPLRHAYVGGTGLPRWRHSCGGAGWHFICICRPPKLLHSHRRCSAHSSYCTLFNNRCLLSACSCVSQNTHLRRASAVRFSAFRLPNPTQTRHREVHGGLWPRLKSLVQEVLMNGGKPFHSGPLIFLNLSILFISIWIG